MNKRILKIDPDQTENWGEKKPSCRCNISGKDKDGDSINITLDEYDAQALIRIAQEIARQEDSATGVAHKNLVDQAFAAEEHC